MCELLESELHLIRREHALALRTSTETLRANGNHSSGQKGRLLCVAIQALFELGRPEEAFEHVYRICSVPANDDVLSCRESLLDWISQSECIPSSVLKMLYQLRRHLDIPDTKRAFGLIETYIQRLCEQAAGGESTSEMMDEEIAAIYIIDHVLSKVCPSISRLQMKSCNTFGICLQLNTAAHVAYHCR